MSWTPDPARVPRRSRGEARELLRSRAPLAEADPWRDVRVGDRTVFVGMGSSRFAALPVAAMLRARRTWTSIAERASAVDRRHPAVSGTLAVGDLGERNHAGDRCGARRHRDAARRRSRSRTRRVPAWPGSPSTSICRWEPARRPAGVACRSFQHTLAVLLAMLGADAAPRTLHAAPPMRRRSSSSAALRGSRRPPTIVGDTGPRVRPRAADERISSAEQGALMFREGPRVARRCVRDRRLAPCRRVPDEAARLPRRAVRGLTVRRRRRSMDRRARRPARCRSAQSPASRALPRRRRSRTWHSSRRRSCRSWWPPTSGADRRRLVRWPTTSRARLDAIRLAREDRDRTNALLASIDPAAFETTGLGGGTWSPKDLVGHLETWEENALEALDAWDRGERGADRRAAEGARHRRGTTVARSSGRPPRPADSTLSSAAATHRRMHRAVRSDQRGTMVVVAGRGRRRHGRCDGSAARSAASSVRSVTTPTTGPTSRRSRRNTPPDVHAPAGTVRWNSKWFPSGTIHVPPHSKP